MVFFQPEPNLGCPYKSPLSNHYTKRLYIVCMVFICFFTTTVGVNKSFCWIVIKGFNGPLTKYFTERVRKEEGQVR